METINGWLPVGLLAFAGAFSFAVDWLATRYRWSMYSAGLLIFIATWISALCGVAGLLYGVVWLDEAGAFDWMPPDLDLALAIALGCVAPALCAAGLAGALPPIARALVAAISVVVAWLFWPAAMAESQPGYLGLAIAMLFGGGYAFRYRPFR